MFVHSVYFWLKEELTDDQRSAFREGIESLGNAESVKHHFVGTPADTEVMRPSCTTIEPFSMIWSGVTMIRALVIVAFCANAGAATPSRAPTMSEPNLDTCRVISFSPRTRAPRLAGLLCAIRTPTCYADRPPHGHGFSARPTPGPHPSTISCWNGRAP